MFKPFKGMAGCRMGQAGFSILEILIAILVFSSAMVALTSLSVAILGGNRLSGNYAEATMGAQELIEELRVLEFDIGPDEILGTADDTIDTMLADCVPAALPAMDAATIFASAACGFTVDADGVEIFPETMVISPAATPTNHIRRTWTVADNEPVTGMKTVVVVVGWLERGSPRYLMVSTAIQGE